MAEPAVQPAPPGIEKPAVLIIGGLGYVGRFLARYIYENDFASELRLVDKQLPELAWLAPEFKEACSRERFVQADASREQAFERIFTRASGAEFTYVFNCGGETRYSQEDEVYKARSYTLSLGLGRECAKRKIPCFVECSTGMVYKPEQAPRKETDKTKPWLKLAKWKLQAEEDLAKIEGLNLIVLRFAHIYGPYASKFLATALCMARTYQHLQKEMKWLWDKDLRTNTVHIDDVKRALWAAAEWYTKSKPADAPKPPIFNIVDHGDTSQGTLAHLIHKTFTIPTGFQGTIISTFARFNLEHVVDDVNDELLDPWAELQAANKAAQGPISPYVEKELLKDTDLSMDGSAFEKATGFTYERDHLEVADINDVIESYKRMNWWP